MGRNGKRRAKDRPVAVELFCGVGGMSLGFEQAGFRVAAAIDSNPINVEYHKKNFPKCKTIEGDLFHVTGADIRKKCGLGTQKILAVIGGPPCQGFSLIGKRDLTDERNQLIFRFIKLVGELGADYFVMENVAGLTVGPAKKKLSRFVALARKLGYDVVVPIQVLDAADHGVPQRRRRVFVLGHRKGTAAPTYPNKNPKRITVQEAIGDLPPLDAEEPQFESDVIETKLGKPSAYAQELRDYGAAKKDGKTKLTGCLLTRHSQATRKRFEKTPPGKPEPTSRYHRLHLGGVSSTLRAGTGPERGSYMAARPIHPTLSRCVTVREAARLHSFPDSFRFHPTKWHGFRQIGNAVPPLLAKRVAASVLAAVAPSPGTTTRTKRR